MLARFVDGSTMLLRFTDAAERLAISPRHLRNVIHRLGLESEVVRLGRSARLPAGLVERLARGAVRDRDSADQGLA